MEVHAGDSPVHAAVPFWVTACVRLAPPVGRTGKPTESADKIVTAAQVLLADRVRVEGEDRVLADRHTLARFLGYGRSDKARWVTDYLESIRFLVIKDQEQDKRGRRRNRMDPNTGRAVPDQWSVREQPPLGYAGPRSFAELRDALAEERVWTLDELFVSVQVSPGPSREGPREASSPSREGLDSKPQVSSSPSREGPLEGERERTLFESSLPRSIKASAPPPATGGPDDDALNQQVRDEVVRQMPWRKHGHVLTLADEQRLVPVMAAAIRDHGLTLAQVREHALFKLGKAKSNPISYLCDGFSPERLPVPTNEVLEVPTGNDSADAGQSSADGANAPGADTAQEHAGAEEPRQPSSAEARRQFVAELQRAQQGRKRQKIVQAAQRDAEVAQGQEHTA